MIPGISTQVLLSQRLSTATLDALRDGGARAIELRAARWHVDYTDRAWMREIGAWFRGNDVLATLHAPVTADTHFSRHGSTPLNLVDRDRGRRIAAMDEVKRALELAEHFPVRSCVVPLGDREDRWSERVLEFSLVAVEHLNAFAGPLGVQLLLENLGYEVATPEHLLEVLAVGHFSGCGVCFNLGHAHRGEAGPVKALDILRERLREVHVSDVSMGDRNGKTDVPLWPACEGTRPGWAAAGSLDWHQSWLLLATLPADTIAMLDVAETPGVAVDAVSRMLRQTLAYARQAEETGLYGTSDQVRLV